MSREPGQKRVRIQTNVPRGKTKHRAPGGGGKPPKKGCAVLALAMLAAPVAAVWGVVEGVKAVL